ncbi:MAG: guanylate kinase [Chloroflexi bacterium]|nr:guanylate kinase [Chloroflexota bacterium]
MTERALFVVLSGPSGAGKDTLLRGLLARDDRVHGVVTAKTRPRRPGEEDGVHHHFLSESEFKALVEAGEFLEYAEVYGHRSGVLRAPVRQALARGATVVARTDLQGARSLRRRVPGALLIFVTVPDLATLERRLRARGDVSEDDIRQRLSHARSEMAAAVEFDSVVVNREGAEAAAIDEVLGILQRERARPDRLRPVV